MDIEDAKELLSSLELELIFREDDGLPVFDLPAVIDSIGWLISQVEERDNKC